MTQPGAVTRQEEPSINEETSNETFSEPSVNDETSAVEGETLGTNETLGTRDIYEDKGDDYNEADMLRWLGRPGEQEEMPDDETNESKGEITFEEDQSNGYRERTIKNASADVTIALAVDFNSSGERLTKSSVKQQGKLYIPIDANNLEVTQERVDKIVGLLNNTGAKTLNIAGNGIYTMKGKYTQEQIDGFTYGLLRQVLSSPNLKTPIESIRSGGQTGFDEAGAKAGLRLGIPTTVLAPKGWKFRDVNGRDISDEKAFKERFNTAGADDLTNTSTINVYAGTNEHAELSNFAYRPFKVESVVTGSYVTFNTVEGAFQAQKLSYTNLSTKETADIETSLMTAKGNEAKSIGRNIKGVNTKR
ncbi:MAG: hypothetical protein LBL24_08960 [Bacteroidales bacterium]|nr:hypothetical protein [Bacteroidales bacterium]